jgi:hypothetical protein
MTRVGGWILTVLALSLASPARGDEQTCEFDEGTRSEARLVGRDGGWVWERVAQRAAEFLGARPGARLWFMSVKLADGATEASLAGSHTPPATDYWAARVLRQPSQVVLVDVGSNNIRVLAVSTVPGPDGRLAATYSSQIGGPDSQVVEQFTGSCRRTGGT